MRSGCDRNEGEGREPAHEWGSGLHEEGTGNRHGGETVSRKGHQNEGDTGRLKTQGEGNSIKGRGEERKGDQGEMWAGKRGWDPSWGRD